VSGAPPERPAEGGRNPWWIPPFLGRVPPELSPQLPLLGALALALLFENYDQAMLTQALKHIAEDFGVGEASLGYVLSLVRLGSVGAFLMIPLVDRFGRRRLFLVSIIGMSVSTVGCAFAPGIAEFVALQMAGRFFMITASATAFVIVAEEFPAAHRGWGIGILGALSTFGVGLSAILFATIEYLPYTWRAMYLLGVVPVVLLPMFRRRVAETARFHRHREANTLDVGMLAGWWRPLRDLATAHPGRTLAVALIGMCSSGGYAVAYNWSAYFVQAEHGWAPGHYSALLLTAGVAGIIGHPYAGRFADRRGRRRVGLLFFGAFPFLALGFYHGPGWLLPVVWVPLVFTMTGGSTISRALAAELFPTSHRGTASGWLQLLDTLGAAGLLALVSLWTPAGESAVPAISVVVFASLLAAGVVLFLPETRSRELEEISGEDAAAPPAPPV